MGALMKGQKSKSEQVRDIIRANPGKTSAELIPMVVEQLGMKLALAKVYVPGNIEAVEKEKHVKPKMDKPKRDKNRFATTTTASQVNADNVMAISAQFGYEVGNRSVDEQVEYVRIVMKAKGTSFADELMERLKNGEPEVSPDVL